MKINNCFELIEYDDIKDIPVDNDNSNSSDESDYKKKLEEYSDSESSSIEEKELNNYNRDFPRNNDESDNDEKNFKSNKGKIE